MPFVHSEPSRKCKVFYANPWISLHLLYHELGSNCCLYYGLGDSQETLYYTIHSRIKASARLAIEELSSCRVWLNSQEADETVQGYYVDPSLSVIDLPALQPGENQLRVEVHFKQKSNLEALYLLGDFDVVFEDTVPWITEKSLSISWGTIVTQGDALLYWQSDLFLLRGHTEHRRILPARSRILRVCHEGVGR